MSVTLKELADRAGVSPMTISRALRGVGRVKDQTRRRVLRVAEELGYFRIKRVVFPPPVRQGHTDHNLRLLVPYSHSDLLTTEPGQQFLTGIKRRLNETGGFLFPALFQSAEDILDEARKHHVHGIVLRQTLPATYLQKLTRHYAVVCAAADDFYAGVDSVFANENRCAAQILDHLTFYKHKDVAFFGVVDSDFSFRPDEEVFGTHLVLKSPTDFVQGARYAAWNCLAQCHNGSHPLSVRVDRRDGRLQTLDDSATAGLRQLLGVRPRPTALVVAGDLIAIAVIRALEKLRMKVPDDMSIMSYGSTREGRQHKPPITSMQLPWNQIGHTAPELIERRLSQAHAAPLSVQLEATIFKGETVAPPRQAKRR